MGLFDSVAKGVVANTLLKTTDKIIDKKRERDSEFVRIPYDVEHYLREDFDEVYAEFVGYGFINVTGVPIRKKLRRGLFGNKSDDNKVESIIVGGKDSFRERSKFRRDVGVVIKYYALWE